MVLLTFNPIVWNRYESTADTRIYDIPQLGIALFEEVLQNF